MRLRLSLRRREKQPKGVTVAGSSSSFFTSTLALVFILIFLFYAVYAVRYAVKAYAGVATTKHNLSVNGPGTIKAAPGQTTEICVFCHTPHGAIVSDSAPLWNHTLSTVANYTVFNSATLLSTVGQPDKGSKLCLSCHDGTVAIGAVKNTPGPGSTGLIQMTGVDAQGRMPVGPTNWGTNVTSHPISVAVNDNLIADKQQECSNMGCIYVNGQPVCGQYYITYPTPPVRLRPTNATYASNPGKNGKGVQCASCHDPHNNNTSWGNFFITNPSNNGLCNACHIDCCCLDFSCSDMSICP